MDGRGFRFGDWQVDVGGNALSHGDARATLEPRAMDVLRYLCRHPGAVIPAEELLQKCWGTAELGDNPVHKAIAQLRRALGDSSTEPRYIETVRKRGYRAIATVVEAADHADNWQGGSPFRGLEAFQESHAAIFFGRVQATHRLRELVLAQAAAGCPMALVLGPSGSGKTSLVRAGLLPALADADRVALTSTLHMDCADLGGSDLFGALAAVLLDAEIDGKPCFDGSSAEALGRRLRAEPARVTATLDGGGPIRTAVFIDRLEAIFRAPATSDGDRACFVAVLEQLARAGVLVVLACRNDFYPALIALPELMALKGRGGHFDVEPPGGAEIAQMVRQPARAAQLAFEHDAATGANLDDVLCDAARASPDALPLLQYCLDELYRQRGDDGTLRFDVFRQLGGIEGALGVRAEQVVAQLPGAQQAALPHVLSLLVNIGDAIGDNQSAVTARRTPWAALDSEAKRELVRALVEARLFVSELTGDVPTFGVAHEALLRRWPRVVEWIERHRQALQIRTRVAAQAERWAAAGRPRDLLLPEGTQANQARGLLEIADLALSSQEKDYVETSLRRARLGSRIRFAAMAIIGLLAVLAAALGLAARSAQQEAEQRRADAESLMSFMLGDFVDKLRPLGRLDLLDDVTVRAYAYLSSRDSDNPNHKALLQKAKTLQLIAEVDIARAKPAAAEEALHAARAILTGQLDAGPRDKEVLKTLGANAFWLGQLKIDREDWPAAMTHMTAYRRYSEELIALEPDDVDALMELSYATNSVGSVAMGQRDFERAVGAFAASIKLKEQASRKRGGDNMLADLANAYSWLARAQTALGQLAHARKLYQVEQKLLRPIAERNPTNASWTFRLASAISRQAEVEQALGYDSATTLYQDAIRLVESTVAMDPTNLAWQRNLHIIKAKYIGMSSLGQPTAAVAELKALREKVGGLWKLEPARKELRRLLAVIQINLADSLWRAGDTAAARREIDAAIQELGTAASSEKESPLRVQAAIALLTDAEIARHEGQPGKMAVACRKALDAIAPIREDRPEFFVLAAFVQAHACLGTANEAQAEEEALRRMHYRDSRYLNYLSEHSSIKRTQQ